MLVLRAIVHNILTRIKYSIRCEKRSCPFKDDEPWEIDTPEMENFGIGMRGL